MLIVTLVEGIFSFVVAFRYTPRIVVDSSGESAPALVQASLLPPFKCTLSNGALMEVNSFGTVTKAFSETQAAYWISILNFQSMMVLATVVFSVQILTELIGKLVEVALIFCGSCDSDDEKPGETKAQKVFNSFFPSRSAR